MDKKDVDRNSKYRFEIHICFLDKNNEPMLKGNAKHWIIYTNKLDRDLSNQLASKVKPETIDTIKTVGGVAIGAAGLIRKFLKDKNNNNS